MSGQGSAHLPFTELLSVALPTPFFALPIILPFFHPSSPFYSLPSSLPPSFPHSINSSTKYLFNSYFMLVCARCWGYSGKQGRHAIPSLMEPTVPKALNSYNEGDVCNDRQLTQCWHGDVVRGCGQGEGSWTRHLFLCCPLL